MQLVDERGKVYPVKTSWNRHTKMWTAYIWILFPILREKTRAYNRRSAENKLAKALWRQGWSVIRE